jgi:hypothetical protein
MRIFMTTVVTQLMRAAMSGEKETVAELLKHQKVDAK